MKKTLLIMCTAALALSVSGCNTTKKAAKVAENELAKADSSLVEKYWKLFELYGLPVVPVKGSKEAHIIFHTDSNRFSGNAGCNRFSGTYQIGNPARITFSQAVATKMMCLDMEIETRFLEVLKRADSYSVKGDTLTLNRARMAPLARFVAVYMK